MKTGICDLDKIIKLDEPKLIILGSRQKMGQTSLALNIATNISMEQDIATLFFSLFESIGEINARILGSRALVDVNKIRHGELEIEEWLKLCKEVELFSKSKEYIDSIAPFGNEMEYIKEKCIKAKKEKNIKFVVIDNSEGLSDICDIENAVRQLKNIVEELGITILLNVELSKGIERGKKDKRPRLEDIKNKEMLELADIIMFLYRDDYYDEDSEKKNIAEVIIEKNNNGICETVELLYLNSYKKFVNIERYR